MTTSIPLSLELEMRSDWHIGAGGGRHGALDKLLDRDVDDLPYVPGSTLRGIWRDAAERLAAGLDEGAADAPWSRLVDLLFGSQPAEEERYGKNVRRPCPGALQLDDLRYPEALRRHLCRDARLKKTIAFAKPGVAIDRISGRAKQDFLRFEEVGRKGSILQGSGVLQLPEGVDESQPLAFLAAAAKLVERLGGKRRRGNGRCSLTVRYGNRKIDFSALENSPALPDLTNITAEAAALSVADLAAGETVGEWVDIPVIATLETPVIIPDRVMGNVVSGLHFIPGFYLLKAVAQAYDDKGAFWRGVAIGDIQVGPLYPSVVDKPGLPAPACFEKLKMGGDDARNILLEKDENDTNQYKPVRGGFVTEDNGGLRYLKAPAMRVRTHNTVEDEKQRPTEDVGGVFSFEALAPGRTLHGNIRLKKSWQEKMGRLPAKVRLGRAARMGYGRVRLQTGSPKTLEVPGGVENGVLWIWAQSDILLPGPALTGGTHLDALIEAVENVLGVSINRKESKGALLTRRLESWQASWGLPRPSLVAIAAGSVARLVLSGGQSLEADELAWLQAAGLGERRGEGFGRITINHPVVMRKTIAVHPAEESRAGNGDGEKKEQKENGEKVAKENVELTDRLKPFAELLERTAWREAIVEQAETAAADKKKRQRILGWNAENEKPVASQLGTLRTLLGMVEEDFAPIINWLDHIQNKDLEDKWGGPEALGKVKALLTDKERFWQDIEEPAGGWPPSTARSADAWKEALWPWAVKIFLLQAMHYHRRDVEKTNNEKARQQNATEPQEAAS